MELREKIVAVLANIIESPAMRDEFADRILAIPELAEAQERIAALEQQVNSLEDALQHPR